MPADTTIVLKGENKIESTNANAFYSIILYGDGKLTFKGDGSLVAKDGNSVGMSSGISNEQSSDIIITENAKVIGIGGSGNVVSHGVNAGTGKIIVESGYIEGIGGNITGYNWSTGLYGGLVVNGGEVVAKAETKSEGGSDGIFVNGNAEINAGTVTAIGANRGIAAMISIAINGGTVIAEGKNECALLVNKELTISDKVKVREPVGGKVGEFNGAKALLNNDGTPAKKAFLEFVGVIPPSGNSDKDDDKPSSSGSANNVYNPVTAIKNGINDIGKAVSEAKKVGDTLHAVLKNVKTADKDLFTKALNALKDKNAPLTIDFDSTSKDGKILARMYVDAREGAKLRSAINPLIYTEKEYKENFSTENIFEHYFKNDVEVISFGQKGDFGIKIKIAARIDLSKIGKDNLYFYAYNKESNKYTQLDRSKFVIDSAGFLHFEVENGNQIIISNGPLQLR